MPFLPIDAEFDSASGISSGYKPYGAGVTVPSANQNSGFFSKAKDMFISSSQPKNMSDESQVLKDALIPSTTFPHEISDSQINSSSSLGIQNYTSEPALQTDHDSVN
jgi:hypothetical protein